MFVHVQGYTAIYMEKLYLHWILHEIDEFEQI